jgi:hypothetical protein
VCELLCICESVWACISVSLTSCVREFLRWIFEPQRRVGGGGVQSAGEWVGMGAGCCHDDVWVAIEEGFKAFGVQWPAVAAAALVLLVGQEGFCFGDCWFA